MRFRKVYNGEKQMTNPLLKDTVYTLFKSDAPEMPGFVIS